MPTAEQIRPYIKGAALIALCSPLNPTGTVFPTEQLLDWHAQLADRNGWLIVDEAFMDITPEHSITSYTASPGLIVLRSLGKFFGLAGARVGFLLAEEHMLMQMQEDITKRQYAWLGDTVAALNCP